MSVKTEHWETAPISPTCEVLLRNNPLTFCDEPTKACYKVYPAGWMSLCAEHAKLHPEAMNAYALINGGERWS